MEGEGFPRRDSSQQDVQQPQEYQIRGNEYHSQSSFSLEMSLLGEETVNCILGSADWRGRAAKA